jgi:hypothetical protein
MGWLDAMVNTNVMHVVHNLQRNIKSVMFCPLAPLPPPPTLKPHKKVGTHVLLEIMNEWQCVTGVTNFWNNLSLLTEIKTAWVTHLYWVGFV